MDGSDGAVSVGSTEPVSSAETAALVSVAVAGSTVADGGCAGVAYAEGTISVPPGTRSAARSSETIRRALLGVLLIPCSFACVST